MNINKLTDLIAELQPNQLLKIGHFPTKEIAKLKQKEIQKLITKLKKQEILIDDYATIIKREPEGYAILIYCLSELTAILYEHNREKNRINIVKKENL